MAHVPIFLLGYVGPETILPAASALAAIGGLLLGFGRNLARPVLAAYRFLFRRQRTAETATSVDASLVAVPVETPPS